MDTAPSPWGFEAATGENPNIGTTNQDMMWITGTQGGISFPSLTQWSGVDWGQAVQRVAVEVAHCRSHWTLKRNYVALVPRHEHNATQRIISWVNQQSDLLDWV